MLGEFVQALAFLKGVADVMGLETAIGRTGSREFDRLAWALCTAGLEAELLRLLVRIDWIGAPRPGKFGFEDKDEDLVLGLFATG